MNCVTCNQPIEADSKFCKNCGAALALVAATAALAGGPRLVAPVATAAPTGPAQPDPYRDPAFEKDMWQGRPAWRAAYGLWFLWALLSIAALMAAHKLEAGETPTKVLWLGIALAALIILVRQASVSLSHRYRLTTQRLFIQRGILSRVTDQMELVRIDDVRLRQGIIDRLVNTGDIEIIGSDKTDDNVWLECISNPAEVVEALRRNMRAARSKGTLFVENV